MERKGWKTLGVEREKLIELLNKALADEWLAYYQYWIGAKVVVGILRGPTTTELEEHASEELEHAGMLVDRIIQIGGTPVLRPEDWYKQTNCGYEAPEDSSVKWVLLQNIKGEQCAIQVYQKLLAFVKDKDPITYEMVLEILKEEVEHEDDLMNLVEDMGRK